MNLILTPHVKKMIKYTFIHINSDYEIYLRRNNEYNIIDLMNEIGEEPFKKININNIICPK